MALSGFFHWPRLKSGSLEGEGRKELLIAGICELTQHEEQANSIIFDSSEQLGPRTEPDLIPASDTHIVYQHLHFSFHVFFIY